MGSTAKLKTELSDVINLMDVMTVLKDVATNRFFSFSQQKKDYSKFMNLFATFFNTVRGTETVCPLVHTNNPATDIIAVASDSSFMAQFNGKVTNAAIELAEEHKNASIICVGRKASEKLKGYGLNVLKVYEDIDNPGRYESALSIRDFVVERVLKGSTGRVILVYTWAKSFNLLKTGVTTLLPVSEASIGEGGDQEGGQPSNTAGFSSQFIMESSIDSLMKILADMWVSSKVFEVLSDTRIAEAAAQASQLESSLEGVGKEKKLVALQLRKSKRAAVNKSMAEVATSSKAAKSKRKAKE